MSDRLIGQPLPDNTADHESGRGEAAAPQHGETGDDVPDRGDRDSGARQGPSGARAIASTPNPRRTPDPTSRPGPTGTPDPTSRPGPTSTQDLTSPLGPAGRAPGAGMAAHRPRPGNAVRSGTSCQC